MKIYLAAKFEQKMDMRDVAAWLRNEGHEVTSQWIDVEAESDGSVVVTDDMRVFYAKMDVNDVLAADVLVAFSQERKVPAIGGGRHVEFGVALQAGKRIVVVGPKGEHIFHYWPGVQFVDDVDALLGQLNQMLVT